MTSRTLVLALVLGGGLPLAARAQCPAGATHEGAALRLRLKPGESRRFVATQDEKVDQTIMGQQQETDQVTKTGIRYDVEAGTADGSRRIRGTYESIRVTIDNPMVHVSYDSSNPDSVVPVAARPFAAIVGHSLTVTLAADGSVTSVEGVDSLVDAMVAVMQTPPGVARDDLVEMVRSQMGDRFVGQAMQQAIAAMPARPAAVGDSWTCTTKLDTPVRMTQRAVWKVQSRSGGLSTIAIDSKMASDSTSDMPLGAMTARYGLSGRAGGTVEVEQATGWIVRSDLSGDVSGTVTLKGTPQGDVQMPIRIHIHNTLEPAGS